MTDPFSIFDERQASEAKSEVNRMKADAMRMIEGMNDEAFEAWYNANFAEMDEAAIAKSERTPSAVAFENAVKAHFESEARRFQFAAATRGHEEPV